MKLHNVDNVLEVLHNMKPLFLSKYFILFMILHIKKIRAAVLTF